MAQKPLAFRFATTMSHSHTQFVLITIDNYRKDSYILHQLSLNTKTPPTPPFSGFSPPAIARTQWLCPTPILKSDRITETMSLMRVQHRTLHFLSQQIIWNLHCYQNIDILIPLPPCCLNLVVSGGWDRKLVGKVDHQSFRIWQSNIYVWSQPPRSIIEVTCITMIIIEKSHVTPMKFNMEAEKK